MDLPNTSPVIDGDGRVKSTSQSTVLTVTCRYQSRSLPLPGNFPAGESVGGLGDPQNVAKYGENATQFPWLQMRETMINQWINQADLSLVLPFSTQVHLQIVVFATSPNVKFI